jgi:protein TonB
MLDGQKVYRLASKLAAYPGGDAAMMDFIGKNFKHIKGKNPGKKSLTITIVIDATGKVRTPCLVNKKAAQADEALEKEIIRVFNAMPPWEPAVLNGEKTYMRIIMPVQLWLD